VQSVLKAGVSIEGMGVTSVIHSYVSGDFTIMLSNAAEGTKGNQHISNIKMDGSSLQAYAPIKVWKRSNVEIYNCTFIDFSEWGVSFEGGNDGLPSIYATGNKFHDNVVINCSNYYYPGIDGDTDKTSGDGRGLLQISGQQTMEIYDNILTQTARSTWHNGHCIKGIMGYNKDIKIYRNTMTRAAFQNETWDFAMEFWSSRGGIEVYDNVISGGVDFSGGEGIPGISNQKGAYAYSVYIHDNVIGPDSYAVGNSRLTKGIYIEQSAEGVIIERNWIKNVDMGIYTPLVTKSDGSGRIFNNIWINSNVFQNIGRSSGDTYGIYMPIYPTLTTGWTCNNVNICNNTIIASSGVSSGYGIVLPAMGGTTNVTVRNNIVYGFPTAVYGQGASGVTLDILSIENNDFYNNGNSNLPKYNNLTPTNNTTKNNITSDPLFISSSDFHLEPSSPAIRKGLKIPGLTIDFEGNTFNDPPSTGAFEQVNTKYLLKFGNYIIIL
jgi:hypothetical protein